MSLLTSVTTLKPIDFRQLRRFHARGVVDKKATSFPDSLGHDAPLCFAFLTSTSVYCGIECFGMASSIALPTKEVPLSDYLGVLLTSASTSIVYDIRLASNSKLSSTSTLPGAVTSVNSTSPCHDVFVPRRPWSRFRLGPQIPTSPVPRHPLRHHVVIPTRTKGSGG
ncbi:hypothetical protein ACFE04_021254 [Oxalis oulophora]